MAFLSRRTLVATAASLLVSRPALAAPTVVVHRDPSCGCCGAWVDHLRLHGMQAEVIEDRTMNRTKARLGVPRNLWSCHTAEIGGYVIEGHVPAAEIERLLQAAPKARGLAVAGMPTGSPGMEVPGARPDTYEVMLFGPAGMPTVFARYRGAERI